MNKQTQTFKDMKQTLINSLNDLKGYYTNDVIELHHTLCNEDYYIIGTYEAKQALENYDVFDAIELVKEYETDNFGEVTTDLTNPEKLVNMLYYIIGQNLLNECESYSENFSNPCNECIIDWIIDELNEL